MSVAPDTNSRASTTLRKAPLVKLAIQLEACPSTGEDGRKPDQEGYHDVASHYSGAAGPYGDHRENCDARRLKNGPLLVLGPAPQARPDRHQDPRKARCTAEYSA